MASVKSFSRHLLIVLILFPLLLLATIHIYNNPPSQGDDSAPTSGGRSSQFYSNCTTHLEFKIRQYLTHRFNRDRGLAASLLRLHFHDCFVLGCDASILLEGPGGTASEEQSAIPNLTLRREAFKIIDHLKRISAFECGPSAVSCADLIAIAARDAVYLSGGPDYAIPLGRKDGLRSATESEVLANLPAPTDNTTQLLALFALKNLTAIDLVALSGAHTIGISHCTSFTNRLYPTLDPTMNAAYANYLKSSVCPTSNSTNATVMDFRSPYTFDNKYYVNVVNHEGLFTSDQDLYDNETTSGIVTSFEDNQGLFFEDFVAAIVKMGELGMMNPGEIRTNCSVRNSDEVSISNLVDLVKEHLKSVTGY